MGVGHKRSNKQSVIINKEEMISSHNDDINKIVNTRHGEIEDGKRRRINIAVFNLPEHNFRMGLTNEPRHEISNNVVCTTSKASDQPAHMAV